MMNYLSGTARYLIAAGAGLASFLAVDGQEPASAKTVGDYTMSAKLDTIFRTFQIVMDGGNNGNITVGKSDRPPNFMFYYWGDYNLKSVSDEEVAQHAKNADQNKDKKVNDKEGIDYCNNKLMKRLYPE